MVVRRVAGESMLPGYRPGSLVLARCTTGKLHEGDVVIIFHGGLEKIKRITGRRGAEIFVRGDNAAASTDSRQFGWLPVSSVIGKVIWPIVNKPR